jgi:hypothetical protein
MDVTAGGEQGMSKAELRTRILNSGHQDEEFESYVKELLDNDKLDGDVVIGIAKQIVSKGAPSISDYQLDTFINHGIWEHLYEAECRRCGEDIPWSEMLNAVEESGNCSYCQHMIDKDD